MSKIVHIMLDCFYKNGFGYQENILPAKHRQLGHEVHIITYNQGGDASYHKAEPPVTYINPDNIPVHVLAESRSILKKMPVVVGWVDKTVGLYDKLEELQPDIIFIHGICLHDNLNAIRYKENHPDTIIYADSHSDYYNTPVKLMKEKIYRYGFGRYIGKKMGKTAEKVWGVTPWRVDYLKEVYQVPGHKVDLLVMGGDDDKIDFNNSEHIRYSIRKEHNIPQDAFLIITGGKIDKSKNIHCLIEAIEKLNRNDVHLLVFGRTEADMHEYMEKIQNKRIHYIGWIDADKCYDYYLASDLACFPGTHSVLWEQACATGLPAIFKDWNGGFSHVDIGGNCILIKDTSAEGITQSILPFIDDKNYYDRCKETAYNKGRKEFLYIEIAKKAIGVEKY